MEPVLDITLWLTLCSVGFVAGFIDAIAGGGGMLTIPTLLTSGLPPHIALGTNKLAASFGSSIASFTFYKKKLFDPTFWKYSLYSPAVGAIIGAVVISYLPSEFIEKVLPLLIVVTAVYTLLAKDRTSSVKSLPTKNRNLIKKQIIQGEILGFYDGFAGPGAGAFWTVSSSALYKIHILLSCGLARSNTFISNFCSLLTFIYLGYVNALIGISMGIFIMLGASIGANTAIKHGQKFIRPVFIVVVIGMSVNLAYHAWF